MVKWDGIEDTGPLPTRVWLSRTKIEDDVAANNEEWKPLRKVDCKKLNDEKSRSIEYGHRPVLIESGRATADPDFGIIRANFVAKSPRELVSCTWFVVTDEKKDPQTGVLKPVLEPMPDDQAERVEDMYQRAIYAASVYGDGIGALLKEKTSLGDTCTDSHIELCKEGRHYLMRKVPDGWFSKSFKLQRGHGSYTVDGEEEEEILGPIHHVVFVVHGIGEAVFSKDETASMVYQIDQLRLTFQKRQIADWKKKCEVAKKKEETIPEPPNRVEFLPILWYDRVHDNSNAMMKSLNCVTLKTIPALRSIANDVVLDVLLYMTPNYCHDVLKSVTDQILSVYGVFNKTFPDFASRGGKCSLIGHSLGSVICWDLLSLKKKSLQKPDNEHETQIKTSSAATTDKPSGIGQRSSSNSNNDHGGGAWGPSLSVPYDTVIPFEPDFTMFVGSPIGLFLSLRGAHADFDSIREASNLRISPFVLPSKAIYNIFSPSDPIAYRIEPLLMPQNNNNTRETLPDPIYLTRFGEDVRFHIKALQIVSFFSSAFPKAASTEEKTKNEIPSKASTENGKKKEEQADESDSKEPLRFPLGGRSTRLDYQLQPSVIDNEYIRAVTAHSVYFQNTDIIDFAIDITGQVDGESNEMAIDLTADNNDKQNE